MRSRTPLTVKNNPTQRKFWKYLIGLQSYSKPSLSQFVPLDKRKYFTEGLQKFLNLCVSFSHWVGLTKVLVEKDSEVNSGLNVKECSVMDLGQLGQQLGIRVGDRYVYQL